SCTRRSSRSGSSPPTTRSPLSRVRTPSSRRCRHPSVSTTAASRPSDTKHRSSERGRGLWKDRAMLRWLTAGESHGPELIAIVEGLPAGVPVSLDAIRADLARRKLGYGRGSRMKFEQDELNISGGVRHGYSLGSPVAVRIGNTEWPKWVEVMNPEPVEATEKSRGRSAPLTRPRPGHAD